MACKQKIHTLRRIPKGARYSSADKLSSVINNCVKTNSAVAWENLLLFSYKAFNINESNSKNLTSKIKLNISNFNNPLQQLQNQEKIFLNRFQQGSKQKSTILTSKEQSNYILSSEDSLASFDDTVFQALKKKHPKSSRHLSYPDPPENNNHNLSLNESEVLKRINSFPNGSAPRIDGMRPQFLKDMISFSAGEAGKRALTSLTSLCNFILAAKNSFSDYTSNT
jgi:hypothetical protein